VITVWFNKIRKSTVNSGATYVWLLWWLEWSLNRLMEWRQ